MGERTVAVAMSGGVDSSTAAALLAQQGHRVFGLTMILLPGPADRDERGGSGERHLADARAVCARLGIPHHAVDLRREFAREVVEPFTAAYLAGRTPNPCALCNARLKFRALLDRSALLGADLLATGHYVRLAEREGRARLLRGLDPGKDQSYFLFSLGPRELPRLLFPLGGMRKQEVRTLAFSLGIPVHDKPESQDACFLPPGGVKAHLRAAAGADVRPGPILDLSGRRLGTHPGACFFTVGQRKGLGIASPEPLYVVRIEAGSGAVVLGTREEASSPGLTASGASWTRGEPPRGEVRAAVQVRHRHLPAPATVRAGEGGRFEVRFDRPQLGVAPGQAAVVYEGDELLGGGWIDGGCPAVPEGGINLCPPDPSNLQNGPR